MAINKSKTAPIVKVGIGVLAVFLIIGVSSSIIPGIATFFGTDGAGQATQGPAEGSLDALAGRYGPQVVALEQQLAADPASQTVLSVLGNTYFNWAADISNSKTAPQGSAAPYWTLTIDYYKRALAVKYDAPMATDLAIALDYSGRLDEAIAAAREVNAKVPTFAPAYYHLGRFLQRKGEVTGSVAALNKYLQMDPEGKQLGGDPADAKKILGELAGAQSAPTSPTP